MGNAKKKKKKKKMNRRGGSMRISTKSSKKKEKKEKKEAKLQKYNSFTAVGKSKNRKKGNLNSEPSFPQIDREYLNPKYK